MASRASASERAKMFGADISDIPIVVRASGLTFYDYCTGWIPEHGNMDELKQFCGSIIRRMDTQPDVAVYDLDVLLAIGAGISLELDQIRTEQSETAQH